jgi:toxin-antitoxin system PIN domain toxin
VIIVDANVLLYAYNPSSPHHEQCRSWLESALNGSEQVGFPWQTVLAFVRIATNPHVFTRPLSAMEAASIVDEWLACPQAMRVEPADGYWELLKEQLVAAQICGPLVTDAALAALAIQNGARLCTTDRDFARFAGLKTFDPRAA